MSDPSDQVLQSADIVLAHVSSPPGGRCRLGDEAFDQTLLQQQVNARGRLAPCFGIVDRRRYRFDEGLLEFEVAAAWAKFEQQPSAEIGRVEMRHAGLEDQAAVHLR